MKKLPFSAARKAGNTLYISGNIGMTPEGEHKKESVSSETHQIMKNIGRVLKEHGYTYEDIVSAVVYLKDIDDYHEMNRAYAQYFKGAYPSRTCIGGVDIVFGFRVEITCTAYKE